MTPYYTDEQVTLYHGDCVEVLRTLPDASIDSIITDPPYNLSFMAKTWDALDGREDAGFAYWLAGLIDGEGCFTIKAHTRGTHAPSFAIKLRADDIAVLEHARRTLGAGTVTIERRAEGNDMARWVVGDKVGCQRLVDLLDKYPLRAKKRIDYWTWREAVCEWTGRGRGNRWHGAADNERMAALRERLMSGRAYTDIAWSGNEFQDWCRLWAAECLRVLKPGGHMLAFGGSRTWHRLAAAIEDAGFEIRDSIAWLYGSGFPKSLDVSKAIDKAAGAEREATGTARGHVPTDGGNFDDDNYQWRAVYERKDNPATDAAKQWQGWGTALKPSHEPVVVARKPHVIGGILDGIGSELTRLEDECRRSACVAARSSAPTPADSPEARTATAPASAATQHEAGQESTTPTGAAVATSDRTATSWSDETTAPTPWSTVSSWRACWAELCELTSTSTTSTTTEATTDLRTLWSSISSLTVTSTPDSPTPALTSPSTALGVDSLFAATVLRLRATLALSAPESATASTPHVPQAAGGSSAFEPIVVARKPLAGTVAANVLEHGTGALNIDACRIPAGQDYRDKCASVVGLDSNRNGAAYGEWTGARTDSAHEEGRWPTNVVLDEAQAAELDAQTGYQRDGTHVGRNRDGSAHTNEIYGARKNDTRDVGYGGGGGGSRFFPVFRYEAKAPGAERPSYVNEDGAKVAHNTVKPLDLMRWLVRLVTPPNGVVLDPFAGSGTTAEACIHEHKRCITIEREADYLPLIVNRLSKPIEVGFDFESVS